MSNEDKIEATANAVKGLVEAVPVYQDVVQPAARELGSALQTVAKTVHILLAPVSGLVWGYDQIKDYVSTRVAEKLAGISPEELQSPEPNVAGPALESLRYTGHKDELREMYASLLATAMTRSKTVHAHPAFVEMIRQFSSDEAMCTQYMAYAGTRPMLDLRDTSLSRKEGGRWALEKFSLVPYEAGCQNPEFGASHLVNLRRLGLLELRENYQLTPRDGEDMYDPLKEHPVVKEKMEFVNAQPNRRAEFWYGAIVLTPLGRQFCLACIYDDQDIPAKFSL